GPRQHDEPRIRLERIGVGPQTGATGFVTSLAKRQAIKQVASGTDQFEAEKMGSRTCGFRFEERESNRLVLKVIVEQLAELRAMIEQQTRVLRRVAYGRHLEATLSGVGHPANQRLLSVSSLNPIVESGQRRLERTAVAEPFQVIVG